jgi:hypothetical protein
MYVPISPDSGSMYASTLDSTPQFRHTDSYSSTTSFVQSLKKATSRVDLGGGPGSSSGAGPSSGRLLDVNIPATGLSTPIFVGMLYIC